MVKFLKSKLSAVLMVVLLSAIGLSLAGAEKRALMMSLFLARTGFIVKIVQLHYQRRLKSFRKESR